MSTSSPREVLALLNGLKLGELGRVDGELLRAGSALEQLGQAELSERLEDARKCLKAGDIKAFRRNLATITARLGHLK